jgi:hypothetical protein
VATAAATLGEMLYSAPSTSSTKRNRRPPPLRGDRVDLPSRDLPPPSTPDAVPRRWSLLSMLSVLRCLRPASARRWKRQGVVLPVWARWRPPSAAPGQPRGYCLAMPARYAPRRLVSFSFSSPSSTSLTGHGLWPNWSRSVSLAHRSCSVMLLLDASLFQLSVVVL